MKSNHTQTDKASPSALIQSLVPVLIEYCHRYSVTPLQNRSKYVKDDILKTIATRANPNSNDFEKQINALSITPDHYDPNYYPYLALMDRCLPTSIERQRLEAQCPVMPIDNSIGKALRNLPQRYVVGQIRTFAILFQVIGSFLLLPLAIPFIQAFIADVLIKKLFPIDNTKWKFVIPMIGFEWINQPEQFSTLFTNKANLYHSDYVTMSGIFVPGIVYIVTGISSLIYLAGMAVGAAVGVLTLPLAAVYRAYQCNNELNLFARDQPIAEEALRQWHYRHSTETRRDELITVLTIDNLNFFSKFREILHLLFSDQKISVDLKLKERLLTLLAENKLVHAAQIKQCLAEMRIVVDSQVDTLIDESIERIAKEEPEASYEAASYYSLNGDPVKANEYYRRVPVNNPNYGKACLELGIFAYKSANIEEAYRYFKDPAIDPKEFGESETIVDGIEEEMASRLLTL